jgi:5-methylcytosine-specific restriction endonuclease McrA
MKRFCSKCNKLHDHDLNCTVGKFDKYYRASQTYKARNSRKWWATRDETKDRDRHLCVACRLLDSYLNSSRLEVHHVIDVAICIDHDRLDLVYLVANCITLCQHHHRQVHEGEMELAPLLEMLPYKFATLDTPPTL